MNSCRDKISPRSNAKSVFLTPKKGPLVVMWKGRRKQRALITNRLRRPGPVRGCPRSCGLTCSSASWNCLERVRNDES